MVINENNSYINSFTKGMNSDQAYDQLQNAQYTYAKNIRITKNQLIGDTAEDYSSVHEGIVTPVYSGFTINKLNNDVIVDIPGSILGTATVDNIGIVVGKDDSGQRLCVYKFSIENDVLTSYKEVLKTKQYAEISTLTQVSVVLYKELDNVTKAYIATGIWPILTIRVDDEQQYVEDADIDLLINNRIKPNNPIYISQKIGGQLKTSQIQYTYRFYNKYGITTQLAPLTNKIQVIDSNRRKETGNAEDTTTTVGFKLVIKNVEDYNFGRMQIYRLQYIKENQDAEVCLIYDGDKQSTFNDVGTEALQTLTMEEFSSLSGIQIIPKAIENNQDYMFASNVTDDTIIKNVQLDTNNTYISPVKTKVCIHKGVTDYSLPNTQGEQFSNSDYILDDAGNQIISIKDYMEDRNINSTLAKNSYNDIFTSSLLRSLRRGETYKYGIVYYDSLGRRSDVLSLGDIEIETIIPNSPSSFFESVFNSNKVTTNAIPIGIKITLPQPKINQNLVSNIVGCQIVRRSSKDIYQKTLLQVAIARPLRQRLYQQTYQQGTNNTFKQSPYYPLGFLTSNHAILDGYYLTTPPLDKFGHATTIDNTALFQIFSSEIDFRRDDVSGKISNNNVYLNPVQILCPSTDIIQVQNDTEGLQYYGVSPDLENLFDKLNELNRQQFATENKWGIKFSRYSIKDTSAESNDYLDRNINPSDADAIGTVQYPLYIPKIDEERNIQSDQAYLRQKDKTSERYIYNYYTQSLSNTPYRYKIISQSDVKIPKWYEGFSNIQYNGIEISGGIKQYKQYESSIDEYVFNNWVSFGLYDLQIYDERQPNTPRDYSEDSWGTAQFVYGKDFGDTNGGSRDSVVTAATPIGYADYGIYSKGFIGPGPSCLLIALDKTKMYGTNANDTFDFADSLTTNTPLGTYLCNIEHDIEFQNSESEELVQYFGFGNYFNLELKNVNGDDKYLVKHNYKDGNDNVVYDDSMIVFDGDIYITPHEITTMYKAYDFNSKDTLESNQVTNYVPMESKVNTFFDYGMNYLNTQSANLLYEPGSIDGLVSQNRAAHQYNMIYSNNDVSNDVYSTIYTDPNETNTFPHRTYYSEPKINGEFIDNFNIFKPSSFIDVDSKYGEITNLLTDKNVLYYWQNTAFGKFSVNERSLINDQNGNTIMLGQAGILSRYDYISTKYGMRPYDYCAIAAEGKVYWVDINNRAIVAGNSQEAINLGEVLNVQNIINNNIEIDRIPKVDYDLQNNELLCKCLKDEQQIIFNIKYNIATSIYTRRYEDIVYIKNHIYGIVDDSFVKFNYIDTENIKNIEKDKLFLSPIQLSFIVNPSVSTTKVFDSQQIIPVKRSQYKGENIPFVATTEFETDINNTNTNSIEPHTDREGNIIYNIPRYGENVWGNRMRGKWLRTSFEQTPHEFFTISHVITKIRQSYS